MRFSSALTPLLFDIAPNLQRNNKANCCSDPAIKQFLLHLDETLKLGRKFIIQDLDENHLFISADILEILQAKIDDLMDQISFPITEKGT